MNFKEKLIYFFNPFSWNFAKNSPPYFCHKMLKSLLVYKEETIFLFSYQFLECFPLSCLCQPLAVLPGNFDDTFSIW